MTASTTNRAALSTLLEEAVSEGVTPGAVCEITQGNASTVVAVGLAATADADGRPLPEDASARITVTADTLYDLASVSKVVTAITMLALADRGTIDLDGSVADWLPSFRPHGRSRVTPAHLLSHTAGLPAVSPAWRRCVIDADTDRARWVPAPRADVLAEVLATPLTTEPGTALEYSCLGYVTSMAVAEAATGRGWEQLVRELVLDPLGLTETTFAPDADRCAPTEHMPGLGRGTVRGIVHDETAHALRGAAGNAGLFAPARDVTALGRAILNELPGVLRPDTFARLWQDQLPSLIGERALRETRRAGFAQSLGLRIGQRSWMSEPGGAARGHTGFTGTSLLIDRDADLVVTLLTNRVHPHRDHADATALRAAVHAAAYRDAAHLPR